MYNLVDVNLQDYFDMCSSVTRGHNLKINVQYCRTNTRKYFWSNRVIKIWNDLSYDIVNSQSLNEFKRKIASCNFTQYCKGSMYN